MRKVRAYPRTCPHSFRDTYAIIYVFFFFLLIRRHGVSQPQLDTSATNQDPYGTQRGRCRMALEWCRANRVISPCWISDTFRSRTSLCVLSYAIAGKIDLALNNKLEWIVVVRINSIRIKHNLKAIMLNISVCKINLDVLGCIACR